MQGDMGNFIKPKLLPNSGMRAEINRIKRIMPKREWKDNAFENFDSLKYTLCSLTGHCWLILDHADVICIRAYVPVFHIIYLIEGRVTITTVTAWISSWITMNIWNINLVYWYIAALETWKIANNVFVICLNTYVSVMCHGYIQQILCYPNETLYDGFFITWICFRHYWSIVRWLRSTTTTLKADTDSWWLLCF